MKTADFVALFLLAAVAVALFFQTSPPSSPAEGVVLFVLLMALVVALLARRPKRLPAASDHGMADLNSPE